MSVSDKIKAAIILAGRQNVEVAAILGISPQAFNNKLYRGTFNADEIVKIAAALGYELALIDRYGQKILLLPDDIQNENKQINN